MGQLQSIRCIRRFVMPLRNAVLDQSRQIGRRFPDDSGPGNQVATMKIFDVVYRIRYIVSPAHELGFESTGVFLYSSHAKVEIALFRFIVSPFFMPPRLDAVFALVTLPRIFLNCRKCRPSKIEAIVQRETNSEFCNDTERLRIALESFRIQVCSVFLLRCKDFVQDLLTDMPERRVTEVVAKTRRFHDLCVEAVQIGGVWLFGATMFRKPPADLGYFYGVCEPVMKDICLAGSDNLRNAVKPPERRRIENSIPIPCKRRPLIVWSDGVSPTLTTGASQFEYSRGLYRALFQFQFTIRLN